MVKEKWFQTWSGALVFMAASVSVTVVAAGQSMDERGLSLVILVFAALYVGVVAGPKLVSVLVAEGQKFVSLLITPFRTLRKKRLEKRSVPSLEESAAEILEELKRLRSDREAEKND